MRSPILLVVFLVFGCLSNSSEGMEMGKVLLTGDSIVQVDVEIARTQEELSRGLMDRPTLGENEGMLFIFSDSAPRSFWMRNTLIPLDIIFISSETKIVKILTAVPCTSEKCPLYDSELPAQYVLEVNAGFVEKHGIREGDLVGFSF